MIIWKKQNVVSPQKLKAHAKTQRRKEEWSGNVVWHSIRNALDSIFEQDGAEVNQQAQTSVAQSQLRQDLFGMHGVQLFDGLQLNNNRSFDNQVCPKAFL